MFQKSIADAKDVNDAELEAILKAIERSPSLRSRLDEDTSYKDSDASFTIGLRANPLVVIEVDYSHGWLSRERLPQERAEEYIRGGAQVVVIIDIPYRTPEQQAADDTTTSADAAESSLSSTSPAGKSSPALTYWIHRREVTPLEDDEDDENTYLVRARCDVKKRIGLTKTPDGTITAESSVLQLNLTDFQPQEVTTRMTMRSRWCRTRPPARS